MSKNRLPATFTSLYRLFLRTSSASVLHHRLATRNLRQLWRPTFNTAVNVTRCLRADSQNITEQAKLTDWLKRWEQRMDGTLALLYNSCKTRGLPHKLTRNLAFLFLGEYQRLRHLRPQKAWQPKTQPAKSKPWEAFEANAWASISQVVKLAEGRDNVSLGRIVLPAQIHRKSR